jgi:ferredoxin--NADP+ reductase
MDMRTEPRPARHSLEPITSIRWWSPGLCTLRLRKPSGFTFQPGHYARLGLPISGPDSIVWRAYSIVSAPAEPVLEFLITVIPGGMLTSRLAVLQPGDTLALDTTACGFFVPTQLSQGEDLWMFATGAGLGPYICMLREGSVRKSWPRMVLVHSVRRQRELVYADEILRHRADSPESLQYIPVVTRETASDAMHQRIPQILADGTLQAHVGRPLDAANSRVMVCGNPAFTADMRRLLGERDFQPCRRGFAGSMLFENYW